jgi:hypothetical protein
MNEADLKKSYLTVALIGGAMAASVIIYAVVVEIIKRTAPFPQWASVGKGMDTVRLIFFGLGISEAVFITIMKKAGAARFFPDADAGLAAVQKLWALFIVIFALCESVALLGLVLFFLTGRELDFYPFAGLSLLLFALNFPRFEQWRRLMDSGPAKAINPD